MEERKYDAVLVHLYWLSQRDDGIVKPSLRTRLVDCAAYLLYKEGIAKNLVLAAGYAWGQDYPSFAEVAKKDLIKYGVPEELIHVQPGAVSTLDETKILLEIAQENNWTRLGNICFRTHLHTIRHVNRGHDIDTIYVEDVLKDDDRRVANIVKRLSRSRYELGFLLYEWTALVALKMRFGGDYESLTEWARSKRNKKGHNLPWAYIGLPMDKYDL